MSTHSEAFDHWIRGAFVEINTALEELYSLEAGEPVDGSTWRNELHDRSRENVAAIVGNTAVIDTGYIDRPTLAVPDREINITFSPRRIFGPSILSAKLAKPPAASGTCIGQPPPIEFGSYDALPRLIVWRM